MSLTPRRHVSSLKGTCIASLCLVVSCASASQPAVRSDEASPSSQPPARVEPPSDPYPGVNSVATDRAIWQQLLAANRSIRRTVRHTENGVEAVTESDDPVVAAKIIEHATAMQARMKVGARVRRWDPIFAELFENHDSVTIEVTPTEKGVRIVERSDDPETLALLRSHAMGVSDFVREGFKAAPRETRRFNVGDPLPAPELAIGGVPHRFLLAQPDAAQLAALKSAGVDVVVNFRKSSEHPEYDEQAAAAEMGLTYFNPAYSGAAELSEALLASTSAAISAADEKGETIALHCRTGNRVAALWAPYRVLEQGIPIEQAINEARAMQMLDPLLESTTRELIRRRSDASQAWSPVTSSSLTDAQQTQRDRAVAARDAMFSRLFAALGEAMSRPGPDGGAAGAITVCKEQAPTIARAVAREHGLMIGRTSDKLRNPANAAPAWVVALLAENAPASSPTFPDPRFAAHADGSLGVTLPIRLAATCVACHGTSEQIDPSVQAALAATYPRDHATGFKEGDLRGWFWIEVPPSR